MAVTHHNNGIVACVCDGLRCALSILQSYSAGLSGSRMNLLEPGSRPKALPKGESNNGIIALSEGILDFV
jgi:hypothetical protein